jgi:DNA/RNA endonuclease YhcR with UshA esterase domain
MKKIAKLMTLALAVFTLASCEDVPSPFGTVTPPPTPSQVLPTGDGTASNPFNVTAAVAKCKEIGSTESTEKYYVTGVVVTAGAADAQYGNATFVISDEGSSAKFTCFQVLGSDGKKMREGFTFNVGDVVVVYGNLKLYNGNPEMDVNNYIYSLNGKTTAGVSEKGMGIDNPFTVAEAIAYTKALGVDVKSSVDVFVKGKIASIKFYYSQEYGTCNYNISDDGTTGTMFTVYGSYYFDNKPWTEGGYQIAEGDEVIVCGKVIDYKGTTPEFSNKENWLVSINGKTN